MRRITHIARGLLAGAAAFCGALAARPPSPEVVLCPHWSVAPGSSLSLSDIETRMVCGDPKSPVWNKIPDNQAMLFLKSFLQERGFYTPRFEPVGERILIHTGPATYVKELTVVGEPEGFRPDRLRRIRGELLTPKLLSAVSERVVARLKHMGYPCPEVKITAGYADQQIVAAIVPGPWLYFAEVKEQPIPGLTPGVFSRHHAFHIGDRYDADLVALTQQRVLREGAVQGTFFETQCKPSGAHLLQKFVPGPPRVVTLGLGVDTERIIIGRAAWKDARLGPGASSTEVALSGSYREQELRATAHFYFFKDPSRWHFLPTAAVRHRNEIPFEDWHTEVRGGIARTWDTSSVRLSGQLGPQLNVDRTVRGVGTTPSSEYLTFSTEWRLTSHEFELYQSTPRNGFDLQLNGDFRVKGLLSDVAAQTVRLSFAQLWNVGNFDPAFLVIGLRGGFGTTLAEDAVHQGNLLPTTFRHYLGGSTDVRGFSRKAIPASDRPGAMTSMYLGVEMRLPDLLPLGLQPLLFVDAGWLGKRPLTLEGRTFLSPGFGVRWQLPFAVLRSTISHGILLGGGDDFGARGRWQFYFSLGEEF